MTGASLPIFIVIVLIASTIHASLGFGFSVFAMIFFPNMFAAYPQAVAVSALLSILTSVMRAARLHRFIRWRVLLPCVVGYLFTAPAAIHFSSVWDKSLLIRLLGGMLVLLGFYFIFLGGKIRIRPTTANGVIVGMLSGIGGGFFAIGGPPLAIYFLSSLDRKEEYSATMLGCISITALYATLVRVFTGVFTADLLPAIGIGFCAVAVGALLGGAILRRLPLQRLRQLIYLMMILAGIKMLLGL